MAVEVTFSTKVRNKIRNIFFSCYFFCRYNSHYTAYRTFRTFTMIPMRSYVKNLRLASKFKDVPGCIVECGTWRGGMIAGISRTFENQRECFLFDSFEGLPAAQAIDGDAAIGWQQDVSSPYYYDNCKAEVEFAHKAMELAKSKKHQIVKGWFNETLPSFDRTQKIALLRLDGDWYESTMTCLENLYDSVEEGGLIIMDDYYHWTGCARAVHDFLSKRGLAERIYQFDNELCYLVKQSHS